MSVDIITPNLKSMPLFAGLEESKLEGFQRIFRLVSFAADEIEQILEQATILTLPRGHVLFQQGSPGHASYIIVRGAVQLVCNTALQYALSVLGPGRICGYLALIDGEPYEANAITRSETVLLEFARQSFDQLYTPSSWLAAKFHNAILQNLLLLQAKVDNHFARMISQASIRTQRRS